jgi:UDP-glucose 4-epimerase
MRYLVTGGCGFIGSNLVDRLIADGHEVNVIDNLSSDAHNEFYFNKKAKYNHHCVTDYVMTSDMYNHIDVVFHLAAEARIQNCIEDPLKAIEVNVLGTGTVLQLARRYRVKKVLLSSTSAIYGNSGKSNEAAPPDCLNAYSVTKQNAEELCKLYSKMHGLETHIFRYFNVFGERQPVKGQYAPVIGIFGRQKAAGEPLTIVGNGEQRRDFVHVSDVVEANILLANHDYGDTRLLTRTLNVGTGKNYSVNEIAKMVGGPTKYLPPREGEAKSTLANIEQISHLGWKPKVDVETWIENNT